MTKRIDFDRLPTRTYSDGLGEFDASIEWDRSEDGEDLIMNVRSNNGEYQCGIRLNRTAIADLIGDLARTLR